MPCRNDGAAEDHSHRLSLKLDALTKMLCRACKLAEAGKSPLDNADIAIWWIEHQRLDRLRVEQKKQERAQERKRKAARMERLRAELAALETEGVTASTGMDEFLVGDDDDV